MSLWNLCQTAVLFPYLEAYLEVFTELGGAAAQLAVQTLVNKAVELIRAVTTVVLVVTQQCVLNTLPVVTHIGCVVTFVLCCSGILERGGERKRNGVDSKFRFSFSHSLLK